MRHNFYTNSFFKHQSSGSYASAKEIVPIILELIKPKSVVDVGCGIGTWLSVFRKNGVKDILGIDGAYIEIKMLKIPTENFLPFDLTKPLHFDRTFDLAISLEAAEHLPKYSAKNFIDSLTNLAPIILFSSAIPYQGGVNHLNEQWPRYWGNLFTLRDYIVIDCLRVKIWDNPRVETAYAQNALIYVKNDCLRRYPLLYQEFKKTRSLPLTIVHPQLYSHIVNRYQRSVKSLAKRLLLEICDRVGLIKVGS